MEYVTISNHDKDLLPT